MSERLEPPRQNQDDDRKDSVVHPFESVPQLEIHDEASIIALLESGEDFAQDIAYFAKRDDLPTLYCCRDDKDHQITLVSETTSALYRGEANVNTELNVRFENAGFFLDEDGYCLLSENQNGSVIQVMQTLSGNEGKPAFQLQSTVRPGKELSTEEEYDLILETAQIWTKLFGDEADIHQRAIISTQRPSNPNRQAPDPELQFIEYVDCSGIDMIGGNNAVKDKLRELSQIALLDREILDRYKMSVKPILIKGGVGTGKEFIANCFADEIGAVVEMRSANDLLKKYVGESAKEVNAIFDEFEKKLKHETTRVMIITNAEILLTAGTHSSEERQNALTQLLARIDKLELRDNAIIMPIVNETTDSRPLNDAVMKGNRFEVIEIYQPNESETVDIFASLILQDEQSGAAETFTHPTSAEQKNDSEEKSLYSEDIDIHSAASKCHGMNVSDIRAILEIARKNCLRRFLSDNKIDSVSNADITTAIEQYRRSR